MYNYIITVENQTSEFKDELWIMQKTARGFDHILTVEETGGKK